MTAKEIPKRLYADGWYDVDQDGSHKHLKHPIVRLRIQNVWKDRSEPWAEETIS